MSIIGRDIALGRGDCFISDGGYNAVHTCYSEHIAEKGDNY